MKNLVIILILMFITSCGKYKKSITESVRVDDESLYIVYKVDSINNYYLIYATKKDSMYKIVSEKKYVSNCIKIKKGLNYKFEIKSMRENAPTIRGIKISPMNYMDIKCFQFDENTEICKEDGIYDLYYADNIKGICFTGDK